jgi:hypothetical protein
MVAVSCLLGCLGDRKDTHSKNTVSSLTYLCGVFLELVDHVVSCIHALENVYVSEIQHTEALRAKYGMRTNTLHTTRTVDIVQQHRSSELARARAFEEQKSRTTPPHPHLAHPPTTQVMPSGPPPPVSPRSVKSTASGSRQFRGIPVDHNPGIPVMPDPGKVRRQYTLRDTDVPMEQMGQAMVHAYRTQAHATADVYASGRTPSAASVASSAYIDPHGVRSTVGLLPISGYPVNMRESGYPVNMRESGYPVNMGEYPVGMRESGYPVDNRRVLMEAPPASMHRHGGLSPREIVSAMEQLSNARDQAQSRIDSR